MVVKLTYDEFYVLVKIARRTKMDCWFYVNRNENGDFIEDLQEEKSYSLEEGISGLVEGLDCIENWNICHLNENEEETFRTLCKRLNIEFKF